MSTGTVPGIWIGLFLAGVSAAVADSPDPAALVREVRQRESWIERVESIRLKAIVLWERTPRGLEYRRRELQKNHPDADLSESRDLRVQTRQIVELAYDKARIRLRVEDVGDREDLRIWHGNRFILRNRDEMAPERNRDLISRDPRNQPHPDVWSHFQSFRAGPHRFWWNDPKEHAQVTALLGKPEEFAYEGTALFHGTMCHVVSRWDSWTTLYIAVGGGRLCGRRTGAQTTRKVNRSMIELLRRKGHPVEGEPGLHQAAATIPQDELAAIFRAGAAELTRLIDPCFESWFDNEKEVAPGCWLPMTQGVKFIAVDDQGNAFESQRMTLKIIEIRLNEHLPDSQFSIEFKEGELIEDQTTSPPEKYRYKKK